MSVAQLERDFVTSLQNRCKNIFFNRIESMTSVGFPDLVMINKGRIRTVEAKVVHAGDWIYVRKTQLAWCTKALMNGYDCPFVLGMAGRGIGFFRFSALQKASGQLYKGTHTRYKVYDVPLFIMSKYSDWQDALISYVFTDE